MKNLIVILTIFLSISAGYNLIYAQVGPEWVQRYNGTGNNYGIATDLAVDGSGNVYVTGQSHNFGTANDYVTIKYNSNGDSLWVRRYNGLGNGEDGASSIAVDGSGNVYVTGSSQRYWFQGSSNYATIKYNSNGVQQWVRLYGDSYGGANSIAIDGSGNVYVTGYSDNFGTALDYVTIKYDSNGVQKWVRIYNGPGNRTDWAHCIAVDGSGNVYVTGYSSVEALQYEYATIKYNSNGDTLWVQRYNGRPDNSSSHGQSIAVDGSGNVYVTGSPATIKYNSNGDSLWVQRYYGGIDLALDSSGNVYISGVATIKFNSSGVQQWSQINNGFGAISLVVDGSENVYVSSGNGDYITVKYDSNGDSLWGQRYNGPGNSSDFPYSLAVDGSGNVYVTGHGGGVYTTIKYSSVPRTLHLTALIEGLYNNITNKMISDTVRVYLRNSTAPYDIVDSARTVLDSTGNVTLNFFNVSNSTPYYIVIKHRNSIETWSSGGNSFLLNNLTYYFTTAANKAYGSNQKQIDASPLQFGIYSGDVNQNGIVDASDVSAVDNDAFNFVSGYVRTDVNGNNFVDASDLSIVDNNAFDFVSIMRP